MSEKTGLKRKLDDENGDKSAAKIKPEAVKVEPELPKLKAEDLSDDDESPSARIKKELDPEQSRQCPYLDTIDRNVLDFGEPNVKSIFHFYLGPSQMPRVLIRLGCSYRSFICGYTN